jgi:hypothetical protein
METIYPMVPAGPKPLWIFIPAMLLMLAGLALLFATTHGSQFSRFIVTDDAIRLRGDLYGRTILIRELQLDRARVANLAMEQTLRPASRRVGTGAPNYAAGWFRLRNGEKALLYLTDRSHALYIPTHAGYSLLLSPDRPDAMLEDLRRRARGGG